MTIKQHLDSVFTNRKVKIVIGHPSNDTHIIGTVIGFTDEAISFGTAGKQSIYILLKDVSVNKEQYQDYCSMGNFNKHKVELYTNIELLRDTNLDKILN